MDNLRKIVSTEFEGRCHAQSDRFPLKDGTEVLVIPSFLPLLSPDSTMNVVGPDMAYKEHMRPIEIAPDTPDDMLETIATGYMSQPTKVIIPRRPIRSGDILTMVTLEDAQLAHEVKLQALREADK
jgi:hypothetical protein